MYRPTMAPTRGLQHLFITLSKRLTLNNSNSSNNNNNNNDNNNKLTQQHIELIIIN